jgi:hypothetical protein
MNDQDLAGLTFILSFAYASNLGCMDIMASTLMACHMRIVLADLGSDESYPGFHLSPQPKRRGSYTEHNTTTPSRKEKLTLFEA